MSKNSKSVVSCQLSVVSRPAQSLIEVVIAMAVIVGLAVALVTTTLVVQKASRMAKNNTQATKLVQQNIEQVRVYRDRVLDGYNSIPSDSTNCFKILVSDPDPSKWDFSPSFSCDSDANAELIRLDNTDFYRKIKIELSGLTKIVTVSVSWIDSGGTQSVSNQTILSAGL